MRHEALVGDQKYSQTRAREEAKAKVANYGGCAGRAGLVTGNGRWVQRSPSSWTCSRYLVDAPPAPLLSAHSSLPPFFLSPRINQIACGTNARRIAGHVIIVSPFRAELPHCDSQLSTR